MKIRFGISARRANFILTALGLRKKGFYTPYDYLDIVEDTTTSYPAAAKLLDSSRSKFSTFLEFVDSLETALLASRDGDMAPDWESRFISRLDGAAIYGAVAKYRPRRIIEVGSGNSTFFMCRAIADQSIDCEVTCIDPSPRITIDRLPVKTLRRPLSEGDQGVFADLSDGDFVFIDSSHILQPGFDVDILLNRILPLLAPGVILHFHDIFLPYPYPRHWRDYRFNEQNALMPWLISGQLEPLFASHFVWRDMKVELNRSCPTLALDTPDNGGSLWVRKAW